MTDKNYFKLPKIKLETRNELVDFLNITRPEFIFEKIEEVVNPIGRQWRLTITTKIFSKDIGTALVEFKEELYEYPETSKSIISDWLKETCPFIKNVYKGIIVS